jgi:hypothetical protein
MEGIVIVWRLSRSRGRQVARLCRAHFIVGTTWFGRGHSKCHNFATRNCRFGIARMDGPTKLARCGTSWLARQSQDGLDHDFANVILIDTKRYHHPLVAIIATTVLLDVSYYSDYMVHVHVMVTAASLDFALLVGGHYRYQWLGLFPGGRAAPAIAIIIITSSFFVFIGRLKHSYHPPLFRRYLSKNNKKGWCMFKPLFRCAVQYTRKPHHHHIKERVDDSFAFKPATCTMQT